jgi:hypothetical protein
VLSFFASFISLSHTWGKQEEKILLSTAIYLIASVVFVDEIAREKGKDRLEAESSRQQSCRARRGMQINVWCNGKRRLNSKREKETRAKSITTLPSRLKWSADSMKILRHILAVAPWNRRDAADYVSERIFGANKEPKQQPPPLGAFSIFLHRALTRRSRGECLFKQPKISSQPKGKQLMHVIN